ncbi:hypothetical protein Hanom_Chr16g01418351 [Helianthus anomalus]
MSLKIYLYTTSISGWAMMVTNPLRRFDLEPHLSFHPAVTSARQLVWSQYGFWRNIVTKSDQPSAGPVKTVTIQKKIYCFICKFLLVHYILVNRMC